MQEIILKIQNKKIENKLNKLSSIKKKPINKIIIDIIDRYDDSILNNNNYSIKYKKLDPIKHSNKINFDLNNFDDSDDIKPFKKVKNTIKYAKQLRIKSWK